MKRFTRAIITAMCFMLLLGCTAVTAPEQPAAAIVNELDALIRRTPASVMQRPIMTVAPPDTPAPRRTSQPESVMEYITTHDKPEPVYTTDLDTQTFSLMRSICVQEDAPPLIIYVQGTMDDYGQLYWDKYVARTLKILGGDGTLKQSFDLSEDSPMYDFLEVGVIEPGLTLDPEYDIIYEDLNFDGYMDFRMLRSIGNSDIWYLYWVWDAETKRFEFDYALNIAELANPVFDPETRRVISHFKDSVVDYVDRVFEYIDGTLTLVEQTSVSGGSDGIMYYERRQRTGDRMLIVEAHEYEDAH